MSKVCCLNLPKKPAIRKRPSFIEMLWVFTSTTGVGSMVASNSMPRWLLVRLGPELSSSATIRSVELPACTLRFTASGRWICNSCGGCISCETFVSSASPASSRALLLLLSHLAFSLPTFCASQTSHSTVMTPPARIKTGKYHRAL